MHGRNPGEASDCLYSPCGLFLQAPCLLTSCDSAGRSSGLALLSRAACALLHRKSPQNIRRSSVLEAPAGMALVLSSPRHCWSQLLPIVTGAIAALIEHAAWPAFAHRAACHSGRSHGISLQLVRLSRRTSPFGLLRVSYVQATARVASHSMDQQDPEVFGPEQASRLGNVVPVCPWTVEYFR